MDLNLRGKQVLITGGSVGIGLAVAQAFAREGAEVAMVARNFERLQAEATAIAAEFNVRTLAISADVCRAVDIDKVKQQIAANFGGIDILINNAGVGTDETILNSSDDAWYAVWDLHVMAAVRTARAFVPFMKSRGGGVILNTTSICATQPLWYEPIYNTTKAALLMLGKCMANEFVGDNIRVNSISPGLVLTPDWVKTATALGAKQGQSANEYLDKVAQESTPTKRFASPAEIAEYYVFLASDKGSYSVGANYYIDGGWLHDVR